MKCGISSVSIKLQLTGENRARRLATFVPGVFFGEMAMFEGGRFVQEGHSRLGGSKPVNTSGGLMRKGHPIGATGLAQIVELTEQLRGEAGARQVDGARLALQHNVGLGGACVVTLYERADR